MARVVGWVAAATPLLFVQGCGESAAGDCSDKGLCRGGDGGSGTADGSSPDGRVCAPTENCTNGVDDNCDGLVDCADPQCKSAGFTCDAAPPTGWSGPVAFTVGPSAAQPCPANFGTVSFQVNAGLSAPGAMCGCSCDPSGGFACQSTETFFTDSLCGKPCLVTATLVSGACQDVFAALASCGPPMSALSSTASAPTFAGNCPTLPTKTLPPVTWAQHGQACATPTAPLQGGCAGGQVCVPPGAGRLCVAAAGALACPAGSPYTQSQLFYQSVNDARDCSACSCNPPVTVFCGTGQILGSNDVVACTGTTVVESAPAACTMDNGSTARKLDETNATKAPCTPSPVGPTGTATPAGPMTICCAP
jgi:hypothetical protein